MGNSTSKTDATTDGDGATPDASKESLHAHEGGGGGGPDGDDNENGYGSQGRYVEEKSAKEGAQMDDHMVTPRTNGSGGGGGGKQNSSSKRKSNGYHHQHSGSENGGDPQHQHPQRDGGASVAGSQITDDQVHVNLAMADLMAYLQVVANNSNHLPITRRDDPELDRMVTALAPEDYARKSAAFIPADVRVIGATFTRYGRVWDLPTSQEYNACDGAHEPGRSYGGACCNALLKVLYDAANDVPDAAQTEAASQALFDDDDDEEEEASTLMGKSYKSAFSLEYATPNPSTISWSDLLRKMKAEIRDIEYAQVPKITSTRKLDLNKPFSLVPEDFDVKKGHVKRSLLIGCNYNNIHGAELKASHDDVRSMKDYIVNVHGYPEGKGFMTVLLDDDDHKHPTFLNITEAFKALSEESQPGDAVFVQFSGHGGRVLDAPLDSEAESYDEVIVPSDYAISGLVRDTLIFKTLLAPMRYGVTVTILIDSCDNGMVMELPYAWSTKNDRRGGDRENNLAKLSMNEDFSFVRFLKVVKTLYETSTFTQLGRTVGSALHPSMIMHQQRVDEEDDLNASESKDEMTVKSDLVSPSGESIFDVIADACTSQSRKRGDDKSSSNNKSGSKSPKDQRMVEKQSLIEQIMNCTVLSPHEDDYSDEDTFHSRTEDDHSYSYDGDLGDSYESMAEDERSRKARRSRRRRR